MSSQSLPDAPSHDVRSPEFSVRDYLPDWIIRSSWIFDMGFQRMQRKEPAGWMAAMFVFSSLGVTLMVSALLRIPMAWPLSVIGALDLLATRYFVSAGVRRIRRFGIFGPTRPQWWIEIAALDWMLLMCCGCFVAVHSNAAVLGGWQNWLVTIAFAGARHLFPAFFVLAVFGYLFALLWGKRVRGSSLELVNFFFWSTGGIWLALLTIPNNPALGGWVAETLAVIGIGALCVAGVLEATRRFRFSGTARQTKRTDGTTSG